MDDDRAAIDRVRAALATAERCALMGILSAYHDADRLRDELRRLEGR